MIFTGDGFPLHTVESFFILTLFHLGAPLTNTLTGGVGFAGRYITSEHRQRGQVLYNYCGQLAAHQRGNNHE